jgi:bifunctional enzyme CysN/CysC
MSTSVDPDRIETIWLGAPGESDFPADLYVADEEDEPAAVERLYAFLGDRGVLFRPW